MAMYQPVIDRKLRAVQILFLSGIALTFVALASSCGGGVAQEELDAEKARVADVQAKVDDAEAEIALVQSQLAQVTAEAADLRNKVDGTEARQALMAALLAWNRKDSEAFQSRNTLNKGSEGFSGGYWGSFAEILRPPGLFSQMCRPLISLRRGRCNL